MSLSAVASREERQRRMRTALTRARSQAGMASAIASSPRWLPLGCRLLCRCLMRSGAPAHSPVAWLGWRFQGCSTGFQHTHSTIRPSLARLRCTCARLLSLTPLLPPRHRPLLPLPRLRARSWLLLALGLNRLRRQRLNAGRFVSGNIPPRSARERPRHQPMVSRAETPRVHLLHARGARNPPRLAAAAFPGRSARATATLRCTDRRATRRRTAALSHCASGSVCWCC